MDQQAIVFRQATEQDQQAIRALVHGERLNPIGIKWPNFLVAAIGDRIVGAAQIRKHSDGSRELGSLVVAKERRGQGIASRMIDALLSEDREPIWLITPESLAKVYARWNFEQIEPSAAPVKVRFNYRMGNLARILKAAGQKVPGSKPILEINPDHAIVQRLQPGDGQFDAWAGLLYDQALLAEGGQLDDPAGYMRRSNDLMLSLVNRS